MNSSVENNTFFKDPDICFVTFDRDNDGRLNYHEFESICNELFQNENGIRYDLNEKDLQNIFNTFDLNQDDFIDPDEFAFCWSKWIQTIVHPVSSCLVIDVQNDFISGSLSIRNCPAQHDGIQVIEPINNLLDAVQFTTVCYSLDWHPEDHISFIDNLHMRPLHSSSPVTAENAQVFDTVIFAGPPERKQILWPRHCVENTWGAQLHKKLKIVEDAAMVYKGNVSDIDAYSAFWGTMEKIQTSLTAYLKSKNVTDIYVCGIAYDVCVGATAADGSSAGFRTILVEDCCRGVDNKNILKTKSSIIQNYGVIVNSDKVKAMVEGKDRRPELGIKLALELGGSMQK